MHLPHRFFASIIGVGSVEIYIADAAQFNQAHDLYARLMPRDIIDIAHGYSFAAETLEVRLVQQAPPDGERNQTILYWQVDGNAKDLDALHNELTKPGAAYHEIASPADDNLGAEWTSRRSVLADGNGSEFGLVVNPPFPRLVKYKRLFGKGFLLPILGSVVGIVTGSLLASLVPPRHPRR